MSISRRAHTEITTFIHTAQTECREEREKIKTLRAGNKGFTLLELLLVILLIGISASIVVVAIGREHDKTVFRETAKKVFVLLKHARELSVMERIPVTFKIDKENNSFRLEKETVLYGKAQIMPDNITITGESILFFPKGNSSGGSIEIKDKTGRGYLIEVDPVLGTATIKRL